MVWFSGYVDESRKVSDDRLWCRFKKIEELPLGERQELMKILDILLERSQLKKTLSEK